MAEIRRACAKNNKVGIDATYNKVFYEIGYWFHYLLSTANAIKTHNEDKTTLPLWFIVWIFINVCKACNFLDIMLFVDASAFSLTLIILEKALDIAMKLHVLIAINIRILEREFLRKSTLL
ncbi:hypothetical protein GQX74_005138 [Glossina fuscipes]|nr:hypothetical protein GQX74_005138 [Glossina fuscipes]